MPIVKCAACAKDVSDVAETCPHCGHPQPIMTAKSYGRWEPCKLCSVHNHLEPYVTGYKRGDGHGGVIDITCRGCGKPLLECNLGDFAAMDAELVHDNAHRTSNTYGKWSWGIAACVSLVVILQLNLIPKGDTPTNQWLAILEAALFAGVIGPVAGIIGLIPGILVAQVASYIIWRRGYVNGMSCPSELPWKQFTYLANYWNPSYKTVAKK